MAFEKGLPFHLVLCDMRMPPGIDDWETLKQLYKISGELVAIVCTAFSDYKPEEIRDNIAKIPNMGWVEKPFTKAHFLEMFYINLEIAKDNFSKKTSS